MDVDAEAGGFDTRADTAYVLALGIVIADGSRRCGSMLYC